MSIRFLQHFIRQQLYNLRIRFFTVQLLVGNHVTGDGCTSDCCTLLKCSVVHFRRAIRFIGDCPYDNKRYFVLVTNLCNRSALHLTTETAKFCNNGILLLCSRDELIAGTDTAFENHSPMGSSQNHAAPHPWIQQYLRY